MIQKGQTMKILITGAFGNLGLMCVNQALAMGYRVRCFDLDTARNRTQALQFGDNIEVIFGNMLDNSCLQTVVAGVDAIIHNAALLPPLTDSHPELGDAINIKACQQLIAIASQQDKKPVFVYPSSVTVFAFPAADAAVVRHVSDAVVGSDNYTRQKITIESSLQNSTLPWVILRVGVSVDARTLKTDRTTFKRLLSVQANNPLEYVHPKDVALAMCRAAETKAACGKILLLGGGKNCQITQREFLQVAFQSLGLQLPVSVHGNERFYTHWMDTTESQALLQFQQHTFADYKTEMAARLNILRIILWPLRWLINPLLAPLLRLL